MKIQIVYMLQNNFTDRCNMRNGIGKLFLFIPYKTD